MPAMTLLAAQRGDAPYLLSLYDLVVNGGPLMWPLGLCSVIALAYIVERAIRLRGGRLGGRRFGQELLAAVKSGGAVGGAALCAERALPLARILGAGLRRIGAPVLEVEKAVEDAGSREVRALSANLKPLVVVAMISPLLGLLGTVWGMIIAFSNIALRDGLGKPALLATGISQALITTAAGLAIAIPTQAAYFYFKGKIDRFVRDTEEMYLQVAEATHAHP
ncbi:MAG: MotA/TolQ/ExbB proton channel family protein [Planctomycetes bacterium]|nr:MotA/TolQ/ExbB proton channel family protein [Planctomycetota bacterium]